jgi:predicted membrane-bound dolichyl-phosphate-mannose-protein mannosyltransferase
MIDLVTYNPSILSDFRYSLDIYDKLQKIQIWPRNPTNNIRWKLARQLPPLETDEYFTINENNQKYFSISKEDYLNANQELKNEINNWCLTRLRIILPARGCRT